MGTNVPLFNKQQGLRIELHLSPYGEDVYVAAFECPVPPDYEGFLGIYLRRVFTQDHNYTKVNLQTLCNLSARGSVKTVYMRQSVPSFRPQGIYPMHVFQFRKGPTKENGYKLI